LSADAGFCGTSDMAMFRGGKKAGDLVGGEMRREKRDVVRG
jgi:hypothetical protein